MRELVELGLKHPGAAPQTTHDPASLTAAVDRLLATLGTLAGTAMEAEPDVTFAFISRIDACRRVLGNPESGRSTADALDTAIHAIEHFVRSSKKYVAARERELTEMIGILHEAARVMAGRSSVFNQELLATSEKLRGFAQLDDIRVLKQQLASEVATLRQAVEDKQRRDAEQTTQLTQRMQVLQTQLVRAEEEATTDPLTRIANRGAFDQAISRMITNARATKKPLSLAMIDVDHFKAINDAHGHPIGDRVLLCAAQWLGRGLRQTDFLARYGGEEFAVLLKDARLSEIESRMTQMLGEIATRSFEYDTEAGETRTVRFTASAGVAELMSGDGPEELVKRADEALYEAKRNGRNRVVARKRSMLSTLLSR